MSDAADELPAMTFEEVNAVIAAEAAAVAAAAGSDLDALRQVIRAGGGAHTAPLPPGASPADREAFLRDQDAKEVAASQAGGATPARECRASRVRVCRDHLSCPCEP
jgi:hypothetical protein